MQMRENKQMAPHCNSSTDFGDQKTPSFTSPVALVKSFNISDFISMIT